MKSSFGRLLLAFAGTLMWLGSSRAAEELSFTDMDRQLAPLKRSAAADTQVTTTAFLQDTPTTAAQSHPPVEVDTSSQHTMSSTASCGCSSSAGCDCGSMSSCSCGGAGCDECGMAPPVSGVYYAEAELLFMRTHMLSDAVGKLSEKYEFSPRFVVGYEDACGVGARARYWSYGRTTPNLDDPADGVRFEMNIIDVEATSRFRTGRTDLVVAAGLRFADMQVEFDDDAIDAEMPGVTIAADVRTSLCRECNHEWAILGGARWSALGGDWEGDGGFIDPVQDDNVIVQELYGGVEYFCACGDYDLYARLKFEVQNWHSDAFAQGAGTDSISFVGPGFEVGAMF